MPEKTACRAGQTICENVSETVCCDWVPAISMQVHAHEQIALPRWVSLAEHKWVNSGERYSLLSAQFLVSCRRPGSADIAGHRRQSGRLRIAVAGAAVVRPRTSSAVIPSKFTAASAFQFLKMTYCDEPFISRVFHDLCHSMVCK